MDRIMRKIGPSTLFLIAPGRVTGHTGLKSRVFAPVCRRPTAVPLPAPHPPPAGRSSRGGPGTGLLGQRVT